MDLEYEQHGHGFAFDQWRTGLIHTANRGGVVVSAHPGESVTALLLMEEKIKKGEAPTPQILKSSDQAAEIVRFAISDPHFIARKKTGLSLY